MAERDPRILISGSLAYDQIMTYPGRFREHIMADKTHVLSLSFLLDSVVRHFGGTAGNIAYSLALLGGDGLVIGIVGGDFSPYTEHLHKAGVSVSGIELLPEAQTASCYITTDLEDNQLTGFYPGASSQALRLSLEPQARPGDVVLISPTDPATMLKHAHEATELGLRKVLDIGQQVIAFSGEELLTLLEGAEVLIGNDYEIETFCRRTELSLSQLAERVPVVVITLGQQGSKLLMDGEERMIRVCPTHALKDPTGAGDAYRAGFALGMQRSLTWEESAQLGSVAAVYAVEHDATQKHAYTLPGFRERYHACYQEVCPI